MEERTYRYFKETDEDEWVPVDKKDSEFTEEEIEAFVSLLKNNWATTPPRAKNAFIKFVMDEGRDGKYLTTDEAKLLYFAGGDHRMAIYQHFTGQKCCEDGLADKNFETFWKEFLNGRFD